MEPESLFSIYEIRMAIMGAFWRTLCRRNILQLGRLRQYAPRPLRLERFPEYYELMPEWPVIAMVVPSYQQGHFIERTLTSVLSQNYPALVCTVQDGGSKDDTGSVLTRYADRLAPCVSARDEGQADAIVKGFARIEGDIMAWLNADDMLMPGALAYVGRYFAEHPEVDVVYGHRVMIDADDREIGRWVMPGHDAYTIRWIDYVPQETLFWRRSVWEKVGGVDPSFHFALDWDLLLRFRKAGATIRRLPYYLGCFRVHAEQKTQAELPTGQREVSLLRLREHGRLPTPQEIGYWTWRTQVRGAWCSWLLRLGIRS
jgi:glycosyltransferase involved in cell wall biosynthesis